MQLEPITVPAKEKEKFNSSCNKVKEMRIRMHVQKGKEKKNCPIFYTKQLPYIETVAEKKYCSLSQVQGIRNWV